MIVEILPQLFLGDWKGAHDQNLVKSNKIDRFVNLCGTESKNENSFHYPVADLPLTGMSWIVWPIQFVDANVMAKKNTLIHCRRAVSRSVAFFLYYLMTRKDMTLHDAFFWVKNKRPNACPSIGFMRDLSFLEDHQSFPPSEYTKFVLSERFPKRTRSEIDKVYSECSQMTQEDKEKLIEKLGTDNIEPIGYFCIDVLCTLYPSEFVKQPHCTTHHPFD